MYQPPPFNQSGNRDPLLLSMRGGVLAMFPPGPGCCGLAAGGSDGS